MWRKKKDIYLDQGSVSVYKGVFLSGEAAATHARAVVLPGIELDYVGFVRH